MKTLKTLILSLFLLTTLILTSTPEEMLADLKTLIKEKSTSSDLENFKLTESEDENSFKTIYEKKVENNEDFEIEENEENYIEVKIEENCVSLNFVNPLNKSNLVLSNILIENEKDLILNKYLDPFFSHLKQLLTKSEILDLIKNTIEENKNDDIEMEINNLEKPKIGYEIKLKKNENEEKSEDIIEIYLEDGKQIYFVTNYFENSFSISIPTEKFIKTEIQILYETVLTHFERMKRFSYSDNETNSKLDCGKISELFEKTKSHGIFQFSKNSENIFLFSYKNENFPKEDIKMNFTCDFEEEEDFLLIKVFLANDGIMDIISQSFVTNSLYDLEPVVESFWDEVFDRAVRLYAPEVNPDVVVFDEGED